MNINYLKMKTFDNFENTKIQFRNSFASKSMCTAVCHCFHRPKYILDLDFTKTRKA